MSDTLTGRIVSGARQAAFFTQLDWVQEQCEEKLGFKPYPGTLNLEIAESDTAKLNSLRGIDSLALVPPDPQFCCARTFPVNIKGVMGAIIIPAENVRIHARHIIEIISPVCLKETLGLHDGDVVEITISK
ncbi:MAG: DUF120 domain-containing protein [Thermodesulfobacteriota bacterium]